MAIKNSKFFILTVFIFLSSSMQAEWGEFFSLFLGPISRDVYIRAKEEEKLRTLAHALQRLSDLDRNRNQGSGSSDSSSGSSDSSIQFERIGTPDFNNNNAKSDISLKDVIGSVPEELNQLSNILINAESLERKYGMKAPKGILLYGIPGTGKTYYAKALAGELKTPFIYRSATSFLNKWVGESPRMIRELFDEARNKARANKSKVIIFIDEIDAIAKKREGHNGYDDVLNELLIQMDGFEGSDDIIVIGATNVRDKLDPAILRSGRLDYHIEIPAPDFKSRMELFKFYLDKFKRVDPYINIRKCAQYNLTPADIKNIVHQAMHKVAFAGKDRIEQKDLESACSEVMSKK